MEIEIPLGKLEEWLKNRKWNEKEVILFSSKLYSLFTRINGFEYCHEDREKLNLPKNLLGFLDVGQLKMPSFSSHRAFDKVGLIVLDVSKLPNLLQYDPSDDDNLIRLDRHAHFGIGIEAFGENQSLLEEMILDPPQWLREKGSKEQQEVYLLTKVVIKIVERIALDESCGNVGNYITFTGPVEDLP